MNRSSSNYTYNHSFSRRARVGASVVVGMFAIASTAMRAHAQMMPAPTPPQITVSARGEVQIAPDRARVQVGVETQAKTAAAAAAENNKKQAAILAAIRFHPARASSER